MNKNLFEGKDSFEYNGETYVFDLDAIFDYVCISSEKDIIEKEITDQYELVDNKTPKQVAKLVKEVKTPMSADLDNIRYDLVKTLIILLLNTDESIGEEPITYGGKMALYTLISKGLIKKVNI